MKNSEPGERNLYALRREGRSVKDVPATPAASTPGRVCRIDEPVARAYEMLRTYRVQRLPVVDEESHTLGTLGLDDFARATAGQKTDATTGDLIRTPASTREPSEDGGSIHGG